MKPSRLLALFALFGGSLSAQTLYVPGGTIGTSSNGNVGVGTNNPQYGKLVISGLYYGGPVNTGLEFNTDSNGSYIESYDRTSGSKSLSYYASAHNFVGGNVGIGTTNPLFQLSTASGGTIASSALRLSANYVTNGPYYGIELYGFDNGVSGDDLRVRGRTSNVGSFSDLFTIKNNGNVGIGATTPASKLTITGNPTAGFHLELNDSRSAAADVGGQMTFTGNTNGTADAGNFAAIIGAKENSTSNNFQGYLSFYTNTTGAVAGGIAEKMRITSAGNVGIGTTNPTQKLSVNGTIQAKEVIVQTGWSDYVFAKNYRLAPLSEVEQHIEKEGHLSGIPSAQEIAAHGVSLGEMQSKLLAKVEELTLHQIEQEKRINEAYGRLQTLETENAALRAVRL